jgi:dipeptidyl aminopeptidase/acylaminoacyl peptidase
MTMTNARFDRELPALLEDLYLGPTPTYRDEVLAVATDRRQRPAWAFPGRWLPMADIASRTAFAPRVPWRTVGVALLIVAVLLAAIALYAGTRHTKLPPPFGVARNGLVAYTSDGDVYVADTATGNVTQLTKTPSVLDAEPVFAPNGTHLAYRRPVDGAVPFAEDIVVVKPDGSDPVVVNQAPIIGGPKRLEWSPDSNSILATEQNDAAVWLFDASGKAPMRTLLTNGFAYVRPFRPLDGSALLIGRAAQDKHSILSLDLATGRETTLAADLKGDGSGAARWSPDGSHVVYDATPADEPDSNRLFVVAADGSGTRKLVTAPGVGIDGDPAWSPDGTEIAFLRYQQQLDLSWFVRPIGVYSMADGTVRSLGPLPRDVRNKYPEANDTAASYGEGFSFEWSPDGHSLIAYPTEAKGHAILIDAADGSWKGLDPVMDPKGFPYAQGWQRLAAD